MKNLFIATGLFLILLTGPISAHASVGVEDADEMLGYIRVLMSDKQVLKEYNALIETGYMWTGEWGNFSTSMIEDSKDELFLGQIHMVMQMDVPPERSKGKILTRNLQIDFYWSRVKKKITKIESVSAGLPSVSRK